MEEQNKYYTPEMEDIHHGMLCELKIKESDIWTKIDSLHWAYITKMGNDQNSIDIEIRVAYLTKEDIESCGWTDIKDVERWMGRPPMYTWSARKDNVIMGYNSEDHTIVIDVADPTKTVDGKKDEYNYPEIKYGRFRGECKSINELKKIMQWLKIK